MIRLSFSARRPIALAAGLLLAVGLGACSSTKKDSYIDRPVEQIYNHAVDLLLKKNYDAAAKEFDEVERQHPYSVWATKAQLMAAYAEYQGSKYDDAIVTLDRFIQLNPANRDIAYAYYMKALCYYEQITDVERDAKMTEDAQKGFQEVVNRFPNSIYGRDALLKLDLTRDHAAGKEMEVGRYYQSRGDYLAALNRFQYVADHYQTTSHIPEALERMVECYLALGLKNEAERTAAVLGYNYPGSRWYLDSYDLVKSGKSAEQANNPGIFRRVIDSIPFL
jgi:outer membrane protein assembly factor BamD